MRNLIQLQNPGGFTVNVAASAEPPLQLGQCVCRNSRPAFDRDDAAPKGVRADPNYADGAFSLDLGVIPDNRGNIFGESSGEDLNEDTYGDADVSEMAARRRRLRESLGIGTDANPERARSKTRQTVENLRPIPGFPLHSPLAD